MSKRETAEGLEKVNMHSVIQSWTFLHIVNTWGLQHCIKYKQDMHKYTTAILCMVAGKSYQLMFMRQKYFFPLSLN